MCDIKFKLALQKNPEASSCFSLCKFCENLLDFDEQNKDKIVTCDVCQKEMCVECGQTGHAGMTCEQWDRMNLKEADLLKMGIKRCPRCKAGI